MRSCGTRLILFCAEGVFSYVKSVKSARGRDFCQGGDAPPGPLSCGLAMDNYI